jgi:seryl-tRNA synthetase
VSVRGSPLVLRTYSQPSLKKDQSRRACYAANQRHSRSYNPRQDSFHNDVNGEVSTSASKNRLHHDNNRLAAENHRLLQRKESRTIEEEVHRLEEANAELDAQIHGLQEEIDELRAFAPDHQRCDCHIMRDDRDHAEIVDTNSLFSCAGGGANSSRKERPDCEMYG